MHNSKNKLNHVLTLLFSRISMAMLVFALLLLSGTPEAFAKTHAANSNTGYELIIDDQAGYFTEEDTASLKALMGKITEYCSVALVTTTDHTSYSTEAFAADCFDEFFGPHTNGTIFVIDRDLNEIFLYSDGAAHKTITNSRAYSITDNTYVYATKSKGYDYYTCSYKTMEQVLALMSGQKIAEPMKYICSALLAIIVALFINYFVVMFLSRPRKADIRQILQGTYSKVQVLNADAHFVHQTKTYSPPSSSSGGGGHSGGGGGGGHSGGGGGHSI